MAVRLPFATARPVISPNPGRRRQDLIGKSCHSRVGQARRGRYGRSVDRRQDGVPDDASARLIMRPLEDLAVWRLTDRLVGIAHLAWGEIGDDTPVGFVRTAYLDDEDRRGLADWLSDPPSEEWSSGDGALLVVAYPEEDALGLYFGDGRFPGGTGYPWEWAAELRQLLVAPELVLECETTAGAWYAHPAVNLYPDLGLILQFPDAPLVRRYLEAGRTPEVREMYILVDGEAVPSAWLHLIADDAELVTAIRVDALQHAAKDAQAKGDAGGPYVRIALGIAAQGHPPIHREPFLRFGLPMYRVQELIAAAAEASDRPYSSLGEWFADRFQDAKAVLDALGGGPCDPRPLPEHTQLGEHTLIHPSHEDPGRLVVHQCRVKRPAQGEELVSQSFDVVEARQIIKILVNGLEAPVWLDWLPADSTLRFPERGLVFEGDEVSALVQVLQRWLSGNLGGPNPDLGG